MRKLNNHGNTITTVVIVLMLVSAISLALVEIAHYYDKNTIVNHSKRQAYIYAKSECDILSKSLISYGSDTTYNKYWITNINDEIVFDNLRLINKNSSSSDNTTKSLTNSSAVIKKESNSVMSYTVTAESGGEESTVKLYCKQGANNKWTRLKYERIDNQ